MKNDLKERVIVVTGAAGDLGRRVVDRFAREGATIVAVVRDEKSMAALHMPKGHDVLVLAADVGNEAEVTACFRRIGSAYGGAGALIHTVGTWSGKPFLDTSLAEWDAMIRVNLTSAFLCFREALSLMKGRSGRLIAFASAQGADQARPQQAAYSASKAGVVRLVEAVAAELEGTGITAHAIAPSSILYDETAGQRGVHAEDLADLCVYLCSPAGAALNGKTLRAYGTTS